MKSIKELYRIGTGPSSSHTMGPRKAAEIFLERHPEAASFKVTLYGSLAATGKGHMTNIAITEVLQPIAPVEIIWEPKIFLPFHPNGMKFVSTHAAYIYILLEVQLFFVHAVLSLVADKRTFGIKKEEYEE